VLGHTAPAARDSLVQYGVFAARPELQTRSAVTQGPDSKMLVELVEHQHGEYGRLTQPGSAANDVVVTCFADTEARRSRIGSLCAAYGMRGRNRDAQNYAELSGSPAASVVLSIVHSEVDTNPVSMRRHSENRAGRVLNAIQSRR